MSGAQTSQVQSGPELGEIYTNVRLHTLSWISVSPIANSLQEIGFLSLSGDTKLRLLPNPWPSDSPPSPTASLFSIASRIGLLAAADPSTLVIAKTADVRAALASKDGVQNGVKTFESSLKISLPLRVSQVAFSSDEKYLVICAENGGGLQVYETGSLLKESSQHLCQIATNNISVRALIPNPESGHLFAVVLSDGKFMIANLINQQFQPAAAGGPLLRDSGVTCCSWSARGKQLVAGLEDGTAAQLKPDGQQTAAVPRPPGAGDCFREFTGRLPF